MGFVLLSGCSSVPPVPTSEPLVKPGTASTAWVRVFGVLGAGGSVDSEDIDTRVDRELGRAGFRIASLQDLADLTVKSDWGALGTSIAFTVSDYEGNKLETIEFSVPMPWDNILNDAAKYLVERLIRSENVAEFLARRRVLDRSKVHPASFHVVTGDKGGVKWAVVKEGLREFLISYGFREAAANERPDFTAKSDYNWASAEVKVTIYDSSDAEVATVSYGSTQTPPDKESFIVSVTSRFLWSLSVSDAFNLYLQRVYFASAAAGAGPPAARLPSQPVGCGRDTDCKGDRICERGVCVAPKK